MKAQPVETDDQIAIVWNPSKTKKSVLEKAIVKALGADAAERAVSWFETSADDPGQGAARDAVAAGAAVILVAGGDGTVRAVVDLLAQIQPAPELGIIPLGTGNLLARNLGVPLGDVAAAVARALTHPSRKIDVGWAEFARAGEEGPSRQAFAVMAGFGVDANMIIETDADLKRRAGWLAYVESLGRALSASSVIDVSLTIDDGEPVQFAAHTVIVGNAGSVQGGITLLPDAELSDGELDMVVLNAEGVVGWADTVRNMLWDNGIKRLVTGAESAEDSHSKSHYRAKRIVLELEEPRVFQIDGDDVGESQHVSIWIQPGAVAIH